MSTNPVVTVTDELLEELEQLASKATPGPWTAFTEESFSGWWAVGDLDEREIGSGDGGYDEEDARFIAQANPATILALLNHIRTMQQELKAAHISVDNCELFRKDAERYQWLRNEAMDTAGYCPVVLLVNDCLEPACGTKTSSVLELDALDAAIDAAMAASHSS